MADTTWMNGEFVRRHANSAGRYIGEMIAENLWGDLLVFQGLCHSPIEAIFLMNWIAHERAMLAHNGEIPSRADWMLVPQFEVVVEARSYRLDFAVVHRDHERTAGLAKTGYSMPKICIELDGHEFHERTKEQVSARNERDRALQASGWRVFHYSGAEVNAKPMQCAVEVLWHAIDVYETSVRETMTLSIDGGTLCPSPVACALKCVETN
jgi:hypothetical protein